MATHKIKLLGDKDFLRVFLETDFKKTPDELYAYACQLVEQQNLNWTTVMQAAAEKGHPEAAYTFGNLILCNPDCPFPQTDAVRFLTIAANQGHAEAMTNLANCYTLGRGVNADPLKGFILLQKASQLGDIMADFNIAQSYIFGVGVNKDYDKGVKLLQLLTVKGITEAGDLLEKLKK